jgi:homoserine O-acetyltransferase
MHYMTLGKPAQDSSGRVTNGPSPSRHGRILPPISGSQFANELFGPGQLLDIDRYYIILPDNVGPGKSSKPSDGMHARFPQYDYDDMVRAQYDLLTLGLGDRRPRADSHAEESSDARAD